VLTTFFFNLSPGGRGKYSGVFSGVFDIPFAVWSIVSPITNYGVARTGPVASFYAPVDYHRVVSR
jgi:hypothetical protein